ncbi:MAG TPA: hypothetical protein V6D27_07075 [Vampirovibrionales bacterium]
MASPNVQDRGVSFVSVGDVERTERGSNRSILQNQWMWYTFRFGFDSTGNILDVQIYT